MVHAYLMRNGYKTMIVNFYIINCKFKFEDAMEKALINHLESLEKISYQQRLDSIQTWRKMACYVITNMRLGYVDGITEMEHGKSS